MSKKIKVWSALLCTCFLLFLVRKPLVVACVKCALYFMPCTYEQVTCENGEIGISALTWKKSDTEVHVERVAISLSGYRLHCTLYHPVIALQSTDLSEGELPALFGKMSWEIYDGIMQIGENAPLHFTFLPTGNLALSYEPQSERPPLFTASIDARETELEISFSLIEEDCARLLPIAHALFSNVPEQWEQTQGKVEASGVICMDRRFHLKGFNAQWHIEALHLESSAPAIKVCMEDVHGSFAGSSLEQLWQQGSGSLSCKGVELFIPSLMPYRLSLQESEVQLKPNEEPYIYLVGACQYGTLSMPIALSAEGMPHADAPFLLGLKASIGEMPMQLKSSMCRFDSDKYAIEIHVEDFLWEHLAFFTAHLPFAMPAQYWVEGASSSKWTLLYENATWQVDGELTYQGEHVLVGALFDKQFHIQEGWFETEGITERTYGPFLSSKDIHLTGQLQIKGNFEPDYLVFSLQGLDCVLHHAEGNLVLPDFGEQGIEAVYYLKENAFKAEIPIRDAQWRDVSRINALAYLDGNSIQIPTFSAEYKGMPFTGQIGSLTIDLDAQQIHSTKIRGECHPFSFYSPVCTVRYGELPEIAFHCMLQENATRVLEMAGTAQKKDSASWIIALDRERTYFFDTALNVSHCHLSQNIALEMHAELSSEDIEHHVQWLNQKNLLSFSLPEIPLQGMFHIGIATQNLYKGCDFKMDIKQSKIDPISIRGYFCPEYLDVYSCTGRDFAFKAHCNFKGDAVRFTALEGQYKDVFVKAEGELDLRSRAFTLSLDSIRGNTVPLDGVTGSFAAHGTVRGTTDCCAGEAFCTVDLTAPFDISLWNVKPFKITYASDSGVHIDALSLYIKDKNQSGLLGALTVEKCHLDRTIVDMQECSLIVDSQGLKACARVLSGIKCPEKIEAMGSLHVERDQVQCHATLKDGVYGFNDTSIAFQNMAIQCQRGVFTLQGKTRVGSQDLWGALSLGLSKNPQAILRVTDSPKNEGIRAYFRIIDEQIHWEKIQGSCMGLQCSLTRGYRKGATILSGQIDFDGSALSTAGFQKLRLGKGYSWEGDIILGSSFQMLGEIQGKDWEFLGYRFNSLRAGLDIKPDKIALSAIQVKDDACTIDIKQVDIEKNAHWELSIPLVSIREWHPSSMRRIDGEPLKPKPFLIRNCTLSHIHADLQDSHSLKGSGKLTFTNHIKKESTLLDVPLDMIKNLGLDPNLLTPIQGEVELELQGDKMYLVNLKDAFSEAKRSEFYLPPGRDLSYIDFDGKMRIDLKMRQDVALKLTEPFILTIRGTLDNPRYGLNLLP